MNRLLRLIILLLPVAVGLELAPATAAFAVWSTSGAGGAGGAATVMPTGTAPTGSVSGTAVTVRWSAAAFPNGTDVAGYIVNRYNAINGGPATVGSACSGVITTTICTENAVPAGTWVYTVTPVQDSWTGGESPASGSVSVP